MPGLEVHGLEEAAATLDSYPAALSAAVAAKAADLAAALADRVKSDKLSGGVLNVRSGALQASIVADVSADDEGVRATVGSNGDVKYAAIQEYGGKTSAHEILPVKGKALAFLAGGALRFASKVEHPGSVIPEHAYLRSSLDEMQSDIVAALADAAAAALERA